MLPLKPRAKEPLTLHGLKDATTDPATIEAWWDRWPDANVGLRTGVAFDVLDIDGEEGEQSLAACAREHGHETLPRGPRSLTGGDGVHLLYLPTGHGNRAPIRTLDHVDWRGAGGYIVAPPSVHPDTGESYTWLDGPDLPLEPAPDWLVDLIALPVREPRAAAPSAVSLTTSAYGHSALTSELATLAGAKKGQRNHQLNRSAFAIFQLVEGGEIRPKEAAEDLCAVARQLGLSEREIEKTILSAMSGARANARRRR